MKHAWLLIKNLLFTSCVLGLVVGWVPLHWFERHARWPEIWRWPQWTGAAFFFLGAVAFLHAQVLFATRGQGTPAPFDPPRRFVRRGLYKWVRNPMYLAVLAMVGAEGLFLHSGHVAVYFVCLACVIHLTVVLYEENALRFKFGAVYEDYRRDVPRWLPRQPRPTSVTAAPFETGETHGKR
ncbi:MAG: isoprenylcysteine carboxylmethyltransferase family protein [Lacunisphaera sp.]